MLKNLTKIIHTKYGKLIISIILGLGLASLFRKSCQKRSCMLFKAPPFDEVSKETYKHGDKCYKFDHTSVHCDADKQIVEFEKKKQTSIFNV